MARSYDDGSSQYSQHAAAVVVAPPFTIAAKVRSNDATIGQTVLGIGDASADTDFYRLFLAGHIAGDPVRWLNRAGGVNATASTLTGFTANTWHDIVAVEYAANSRAVFVDGGSRGADNTNQTPVNLDITTISKIARVSAGGYFSGDIAWVGIWDVAWNAALAELVTVAGLHPFQIQPSNLKAFWYDDRSGRHDNDNWGSYDLTPSGSPTWADDPPGLQYPQGIVQTDWAQSILQGV